MKLHFLNDEGAKGPIARSPAAEASDSRVIRGREIPVTLISGGGRFPEIDIRGGGFPKAIIQGARGSLPVIRGHELLAARNIPGPTARAGRPWPQNLSIICECRPANRAIMSGALSNNTIK